MDDQRAAAIVRRRILDYLAQHRITQRSLVPMLAQRTGEAWSQSRLHKVLNGHVELRFDDLAALSDALGVSMVELVRDQGRELVADLTPSELSLLRCVRAHPAVLGPIMGLLHQLAPDPEESKRKRKPTADEIRRKIRAW